jgi:osmotically-inducible protein OsmY
MNIDFPGAQQHNGNTDRDIAREIKESFHLLSLPNNGELTILVDHGWVYLEGVTEFEYQRKTIENYVRNLRDVKGVANLIKVADPSCDPDTIVEEISAAFHRHATLDAAQVHAEVTDGKVTLSGRVRSWTEKKDAERVAWASPGVSAVDNQIKVDTAGLTQ